MKNTALYFAYYLNACKFDIQHIEACMKLFSHDLNLSKKDTYNLVRLILTGQDSGPDLNQLLVVFGKTETLRRLSVWYYK